MKNLKLWRLTLEPWMHILEPWRHTIQRPWRFAVEHWRVDYRPVVADSHRFDEEQDLNPIKMTSRIRIHIQSEESDTDPHQSERNRIRIQIRVMRILVTCEPVLLIRNVYP